MTNISKNNKNLDANLGKVLFEDNGLITNLRPQYPAAKKYWNMPSVLTTARYHRILEDRLRSTFFLAT